MAETLKRKIAQGEKALAQGDYRKAGARFEEAVGIDERAHAAWFGLGNVALGIGQQDTALEFLKRAVELQPKSAPYQQRLGELYGRMGEIKAGIRHLGEARRLQPRDIGILCSLSGAYANIANWSKVREILQEVVGLPQPRAGHYCLLGMAHQELGELDEALAAFRKASLLEPRYPDAWLSLGHLHLQRMQLEEAAQCLEKLFHLAPDLATTLNLAGDVALARADYREAANFFREGIGRAADSATMHAKLGIALVLSGDAIEAIDIMEQAFAMGVAEGWILEKLGLLFMTSGKLETARENLEMAVARQPHNLNAWNLLIVVYGKLGENEKAKQAAETVLEQDPRHTNALINLATWNSTHARNDRALELLQKALEIEPERALIYANMLWVMVQSSELSAADLLRVARAFNQNLCVALRRKDDFHDRDRDPERRLRIGWVSSDLNRHPVALFVLPFLPYFDRSRVEITTYFNSPRQDTLTHKIHFCSDRWRDVLALGDEALADLIRADEIDILVDLNGNTEGNRLMALARKPAPILVTWLGFPGTSGMSVMDYIFVPPDPLLEQGEWCAETPWPLPDCYGVRTGIPDVPIQPGLPSERLARPFTFACLNNFRKVSRRAIELWSRILLRVPEARLILVAIGGKDDTLVHDIEQRFEAHGIDPARLDIRGYLPVMEYLDCYNEADLCLDPFPFNGGTTGYDTIWMGVPFVTLPGDMLVSRMGKAILENVGLHELVAASEEDYVDIAVRLFHDRAHLKTLRENLRTRMQESPLMDAPRMARSLEAAFRGMWRHFLGEASTEAPAGEPHAQ
ncbi:MAG: tetratricopeptide repeat protein [Zoogloeaceae bacterium]|jgi:predicted O-linked N-acetylglucosamine transferase (SPINDLY family)|nr:tetratricopeptide repeat protein [Zoogloeaceae bacterium]